MKNSSRFAFVLSLPILWAASCSLINAPDELNPGEIPGSGGAGGSGGSASSTSSSASSSASTGGSGGSGGMMSDCGNGMVDPGELCDGNCPTSCDDMDVCTTDTQQGTPATCDVQCMNQPIQACASGDGCCPMGCTFANDMDCPKGPLSVGIMNTDFYTDDLRLFLEGQPNFVKSAAIVNDCALATLQQYDVVVLNGNMPCFDPAAFDAYTQAGGGLIGTPWIFNNNQGLPSLPVTGTAVSSHSTDMLAVTVSNPADPLVQGVNFVQGDPIGWEEWTFTLQAGATSAAYWKGDPTKIAIAKWEFGMGRAVYLDFHYITSDCAIAAKLPWGQTLALNAVRWAGKQL